MSEHCEITNRQVLQMVREDAEEEELCEEVAQHSRASLVHEVGLAATVVLEAAGVRAEEERKEMIQDTRRLQEQCQLVMPCFV